MSNVLPPLGLYLTGEIAGIRTLQNRTDPSKTRSFLGIRLMSRDQYGGEAFEIKDVQLPASAVQTGIARQLEAARGTCVSVPVWVSVWNGKSGPDHGLWLDTHLPILGLS